MKFLQVVGEEKKNKSKEFEITCISTISFREKM